MAERTESELKKYRIAKHNPKQVRQFQKKLSDVYAASLSEALETAMQRYKGTRLTVYEIE